MTALIRLTRSGLARVEDDPPTFELGDIWATCLEHFLGQVSRTRSVATVKVYGNILDRFFGSVRKSPELITRLEVEAFIHAKSDKPWTRDVSGEVSQATVNLRLTVLASFFRYASIYTIADPSGQPVPLLNRPSPTVGMKPGVVARNHKTLSEQEITAFFAAIDQEPCQLIRLRDKALFLFLYTTLRRRAECARLRWGDIEATSIVDPSGSRHEGYTYSFRGKGRVSQSTLELPGMVFDGIRDYLIADGRWGKLQPTDPVFLAIGPEKGGTVKPGERRALTEAGMVRRMEYYAQKAGITRKVSLHLWRHSGAQSRYLCGQDLLSLADVLQHKSLDTTRIYLAALSTTADPGIALMEKKIAALLS